MRYRNKKGYIAVVTAIILTAILMSVALMFSVGNFLGRSDSSNFELKGESREEALGCLEQIKLKMMLGAYSGNETIPAGDYSCVILPIEISGGNKIIKISVGAENHWSNLELTVNGSSLSTISLIERSQF